MAEPPQDLAKAPRIVRNRFQYELEREHLAPDFRRALTRRKVALSAGAKRIEHEGEVQR